MIKYLRARNITVTLGTKFVIETNIMPLEERAIYLLTIGTAFPAFVGTEAVSLLINGKEYPLIDNFGDIVVAGKLRSGRFIGCGNIETSKYRLGFGANGLPSAVAHFVVFCGLKHMTYNGAAGSDDNITPVP